VLGGSSARDTARARENSSDSLKKISTSMLILAVLGVQLWVIIPPGSHGDWYWPFVEYPMYSGAHKATDSVVMVALRVRKCGSGSPPVTVTDSLGIPLIRFEGLLKSAISHRDPAGRAASISILNESIARSHTDRGCSAQIMTQSIPLATFDWTAPAAPWTLALAWAVPGTSKQ